MKTLSVSIALALSLGPLEARAQDVAMQISIPAQPLGRALLLLGRQTSLQIFYAQELVQGRAAAAISGNVTPEQALRQMLRGTGIEYSRRGDSVTLSRPASGNVTELAPVMAEGDLSSSTEGTGLYSAAGPSTTATGLGLTLRETPQSVTVVTRQRIDDKNMQNLDDVLQSTTGIAITQNGAERSIYLARGQIVENMQIDGIATNIANAYSFDAINKPTTEIYERVEVVRGATGLMEGAGNPSAAINLVRKRPGDERQGIVTVSAGSWDNFRTMLDVSSPLNDAKTLRGRAVLAYTDADNFSHAASKQNQLFYGILEGDLTANTTVTAGISYQKDRNRGYDWSGLPTRADGSFYPMTRKTALVGNWNYLNKRNTNFFGDVQHRFDNGWKLTLAGNWLSAKSDFLGNYTQRTTGNVFRLHPRLFQYDDTQWGLDAYASGPFQLFGREHELVIGASTRKDDFDYHGGSDPSYFYTLDMDNLGAFNPPAPTGLNANMWQYNITQKQQGIYTAGRFNLTDTTKLIMGARMSWYSLNRFSQTSVRRESSYKKHGKITPYIGVVQDLTKELSAYASYTEIFRPQENIGVDGGILDPMTGQNYEVGLKGEFLNRNLNVSLALFQTDQKGRANLVNNIELCPEGVFSCYSSAEKVRSRGIDFEISGALTPAWNISLGYTYTQSKYVKGELSGAAFEPKYPRHLFKVATDYRLPNSLNKLRVGGSIYAQSGIEEGSTPDDDTPYKISQSSYALVGLHAVYDVNKNLTVQFNVDNLFDKKYYQSVGNPDYWSFFGRPRTFSLALRATF